MGDETEELLRGRYMIVNVSSIKYFQEGLKTDQTACLVQLYGVS
jgi:hypothetical protein